MGVGVLDAAQGTAFRQPSDAEDASGKFKRADRIGVVNRNPVTQSFVFAVEEAGVELGIMGDEDTMFEEAPSDLAIPAKSGACISSAALMWCSDCGPRSRCT